MRVLVVDDEEDVTLVVGEALRERGHEVEVAASAAEAVAKAEAFQPQAALVDMDLPDLDGVTLAGRLRQVVSGGTLRVIAFTGYGGSRLAGRLPPGVFDDLLIKPATLAAIEQALGRT